MKSNLGYIPRDRASQYYMYLPGGRLLREKIFEALRGVGFSKELRAEREKYRELLLPCRGDITIISSESEEVRDDGCKAIRSGDG